MMQKWDWDYRDGIFWRFFEDFYPQSAKEMRKWWKQFPSQDVHMYPDHHLISKPSETILNSHSFLKPGLRLSWLGWRGKDLKY